MIGGNHAELCIQTLLLCLLAAPVLAADPAKTDGSGPFKKKPMFVIEEYQLVLPGKRQEVIDYYMKKVVPVLRTYPGYLGMAVLDPHPDPARFKNPKMAEATVVPDDPIQPHDGVMMDGTVRTDRQIVFHSMIKNSYNLVYHHYIADEETLLDLIHHGEFEGRWRKMYGTELWDTLSAEYFKNMQNHYDVVNTFVQFE